VGKLPEDFHKAITLLRKGQKEGIHSALVALGYHRGLCVDPEGLEKWATQSKIDPDDDITLF
jgi:hypothetical protein